jgi:transcriptional regulator with XRE-family HTH domain
MEINRQRIKHLRIERNWTQQHLADACGISLRTVQRIEKFGNASTESVMSLCAVLELNKADICAVPRVKPEQLHTVSLWFNYLYSIIALILGIGLGALSTYYWLT